MAKHDRERLRPQPLDLTAVVEPENLPAFLLRLAPNVRAGALPQVHCGSEAVADAFGSADSHRIDGSPIAVSELAVNDRELRTACASARAGNPVQLGMTGSTPSHDRRRTNNWSHSESCLRRSSPKQRGPGLSRMGYDSSRRTVDAEGAGFWSHLLRAAGCSKARSSCRSKTSL